MCPVVLYVMLLLMRRTLPIASAVRSLEKVVARRLLFLGFDDDMMLRPARVTRSEKLLFCQLTVHVALDLGSIVEVDARR